MSEFVKGMKVAKVIDVRGSRSATIATVSRVTRAAVHLVDSGLTYQPTNGEEVDPQMLAMNIRSYIVRLEDQ